MNRQFSSGTPFVCSPAPQAIGRRAGFSRNYAADNHEWTPMNTNSEGAEAIGGRLGSVTY
jgi:hypothetical protein